MAENTEQQKTETQLPTTLKALVEALIFAAQEPLTVAQIKAIYVGESRNDTAKQIEADTVRQVVTDLNKEYTKASKPYRIVQIAGGYQFSTTTEYADWIGKLYREQGRRKLSQSGIESLAIIAYKQPMTKGELEQIRGVNCDYVLKTLLEKELVTVTGRAEAVGRPLLYGTTREFLKYFGLNEITDLPRPREIEEILGESQFETERRMMEAQQGAEQMKKEQEDFKSRLPHIPKRKNELDQRDVEIVPKKKTRDIRTITPDERKQLEEAGQERIDFVTPESVPVEDKTSTEIPPDTMPIILPAAETTPEQPEVVSDDQTETMVTVEDVVEATVEPEVVPEAIQDIPDAAEESVPAVADAAEEAPAVAELEQQEEEVGSIEDQEPPGGFDDVHEGQSKQKTKWQSWKEKLSGFIKKIFG